MDKPHKQNTSEAERQKLRKGEVRVNVTFLEDGVIEASGAIFITASLETIWDILTDYNHLSEKVPKVVESRLIEDKGNEKIIDQTGKSGILFIEKSVHIVLKVTEHFPRALSFEMIEGDFQVYRGQWHFEPSENNEGIFVSWQARLKPDFFAPPFLVSFVQHQDLPTILRAIKKLAESDESATRTS